MREDRKNDRIDHGHPPARYKELSGGEILFMRCGMLVFAFVFFCLGLCFLYPLVFGKFRVPPSVDPVLFLALLGETLVCLVAFPLLTGTILCWYSLRWPKLPHRREPQIISPSSRSFIAPQWLHINPYAIISFVVGVVYIWFGCGLLIFLIPTTWYQSLVPDLNHPESVTVFVFLVITAGLRRCILAVKRGRYGAGTYEAVTYSNYLSLWRLAVMSLITCGFHHLWWFEEVAESLKKFLPLELPKDRWPGGLILPVYNSLLVYRLFRHVNRAADRAGVKSGPSPLLLTGWYTLIYGSVIYVVVFQLHSPVWTIAVYVSAIVVAGTCLLAVVQNTLNTIWLKVRKDLPVRDSFSREQWRTVVTGWLIWGPIAYYLL